MGLLSLLLYLVLLVVVGSFAWWVIQNYVPEPARKFAVLLLATVVVIFVCWVLIQMIGGHGVALPGVH